MSRAITVHQADCVAWLRARGDDAPLYDACVTDPPYHLTSIVKRFGAGNATPCKVSATGAYARASRGFMGQQWDGGDVAFNPDTWRAVYDALKPGAHLVAFSGTRTYHRMACAIEDAGFEIRDCLAWMYGSGFPKSHNVAGSIDKSLGYGPRGHRIAVAGRCHPDGTLEPNGESLPRYVARSDEAAPWEGWGTALKPSFEPICLARKPLSEKTIAANVLKWGTGALNIDGCRVEWQSEADAAAAAVGFPNSRANGKTFQSNSIGKESRGGENTYHPDKIKGRWPANLIHDGSDEVCAGFPETGAASGDAVTSQPGLIYGGGEGLSSATTFAPSDNSGSAARFFYSAKAGPLDRLGSPHPTIKPVDLMRWLCTLITPPGGTILEPFAGSGTTGIAALAEGFSCDMIDLMPAHVADIERKLAILRGEGAHLLQEHNQRKATRVKPLGGLFGDDL